MEAAPPNLADTSAASRRRNGGRRSPDLPLLAWEEARSIILLEARRTELRRRIARLKPRSHARIIAEGELKTLTHQALRLESERS